MCSLTENTKKASLRNIAQVVAAEGTDDDIAELIRRIVFNTLIGNDDMHLKNWSLIYTDRHHARLAPAYDFYRPSLIRKAMPLR